MKTKRTIGIILVLTLILLTFGACGGDEDNESENVKIIVGATPIPHAEILYEVVDDLAEEGIDLEVKEFTDYVIPNTALDEGEIQANYFQHKPYLDQFNEEHGTDLVAVAAIHYEPIALYSGKGSSIDEITKGTKIAIPNDATNEARALLLLQDNGIIVLKEDVGLEATKLDIVEYPLGEIEIVELEAAQIPKTLQDVDFAVINGNYALEAGLNAANDALLIEAKDSLAAETFANYLVVKAGDENKDEIKALVKALQSEKVRKFIEETYEGAVVPAF